MLTIPLRIPSTSASEASLKDTSQTLIIFCKSSSHMDKMPIFFSISSMVAN